MGQGVIPGSTGSTPTVVDPGTLALTDTPLPGPIGLDAGGQSQKQPSLADKIIAFARQRTGQRVGDGQCFALADQALSSAGAKSAGDFGQVVPDADYVWGTATAIADVRPGEVIQFRDYRYDREITVTQPNGGATTDTDFVEAPHHTAIVESVGANGAVTVLQQNLPEKSPVGRMTLFLSNSDTTSGNKTTKITVSGKIWVYRPQSK